MREREQARNHERAFAFVRPNDREMKPRAHGLTEIRGPYYPPVGRRYLEDLFEAVGHWVDALKFAGITESVKAWRTQVAARFARELGLDRIMFEAADPAAFTWYVKTYGADVNLFVDHSQIVQLECLRQGIWGTKSVWGRVAGYAELESSAHARREHREDEAVEHADKPIPDRAKPDAGRRHDGRHANH